MADELTRPMRLTIRDFWEARARQSFWITRATASPAGAVLAWICHGLGLSPNQVTVLALVTGLSGAVAVVTCDFPPWLDGLILFGSLYLSYALDCADGMLARAARTGSEFGVLVDKLADAVSIIFIPGMLGVAGLREGSADELTWHSVLLLWAIAPRMLFSVLSWLKDSLAYGMDHLREDARERTWLWYVRRFLGNFIDDMTWRTGLAVSWATGYFWEFSVAYGALCSVFFAGYLVQAYYELQPHPQGRVRLSPARHLATAALGPVAALIGLCHRFVGRRAGIVIFEPFGMGDAISLEPLVRALRARGESVILCLRPAWHSLYAGRPGVSLVGVEVPWTSYSIKKKYALGEYFDGRFWGQLAMVRDLARGRVGLDPRGDIRSVLLLRLAGCHEVYSLDCYLGSTVKLPLEAARHVRWDGSLHRWESNVRFVPVVAGVPDDDRADVSAGPQFEESGRGDGAPEMIADVALVPAAPWEGKCWIDDRWRALARRLNAWGLSVNGLCGPGEGEMVRGILSGVTDVIECPSIADWSRALVRFRVVVTVDSGPMHLAEALGIPVVGLFGSSQMPLWAPWREDSRVVTHQREIPGLPVLQVDQNLTVSNRAMALITVAEVEEATVSILRFQKVPMRADRMRGEMEELPKTVEI